MFLVHPVVFIDGTGRRIMRWRCPLPAGRPLPPRFVHERLLVQNFIAMPAPTFSRAAVVGSGGMDETLWYTADWDLWLRATARVPTVYVPETFAAYRLHASAQTVKRSMDAAVFREQHAIVLERHADVCGPHDPRLLQVAHWSIDANVALSEVFHGERPRLGALAAGFVRLGPAGWRRYVRDSRIVERSGSRASMRLRGGI